VVSVEIIMANARLKFAQMKGVASTAAAAMPTLFNGTAVADYVLAEHFCTTCIG
jgi:hypothetical protein